jgi:hypothetical protein
VDVGAHSTDEEEAATQAEPEQPTALEESEPDIIEVHAKRPDEPLQIQPEEKAPEHPQETEEPEPAVLEEVKYKPEFTDSAPAKAATPKVTEVLTDVVEEAPTAPAEKFVVREEEQMIFVLFHLPKLDLTSVRWEVFSDEVSVTWEVAGVPDSFLRRLPAAIDPTKSGVDAVIDYISIRLYKLSPGMWNGLGEEIAELSPHDKYTTTPSNVQLASTLLYEIF